MFLEEDLKKNGILDKLTSLHGPTSYEGEVRDFIRKSVEPYVDEIYTDRIGNVIVHKKGRGTKVVIDAHMDEVGFIITGFNDDGTLRFRALGGVNDKIIPSKSVIIGKDKLHGVIGIVPIHLQKKDQRNKGVTYEDCAIDIGATSRKEAESVVEIGEYAVFDTEYDEFGEGFIKGKAFDDRIGCFVLMEALKENYENIDLYGVFAVQEEVGERGAFIAASTINPDLAIAIEGTVCADMPGIEGHLQGTVLGNGAAVSIMDSTSMFSPDIASDILSVADENHIKVQRRIAIAGGNDAGAYILRGNGCKVAAISVPCRYIHSAISVASKEDIESTVRLLISYLKTI